MLESIFVQYEKTIETREEEEIKYPENAISNTLGTDTLLDQKTLIDWILLRDKLVDKKTQLDASEQTNSKDKFSILDSLKEDELKAYFIKLGLNPLYEVSDAMKVYILSHLLTAPEVNSLSLIHISEPTRPY